MDALGQFGEHRINNAERQPQAQQPQQPQQPHLQLRHRAKQERQDIDDFYDYLAKHDPKWFGGAVMGPSSPPMIPPTAAAVPRTAKMKTVVCKTS